MLTKKHYENSYICRINLIGYKSWPLNNQSDSRMARNNVVIAGF